MEVIKKEKKIWVKKKGKKGDQYFDTVRGKEIKKLDKKRNENSKKETEQQKSNKKNLQR